MLYSKPVRTFFFHNFINLHIYNNYVYYDELVFKTMTYISNSFRSRNIFILTFNKYTI